ncbi:MAG TPA: class I SAM-dependent methyltransferase [Candidatus Paceibacterota bacterium]
MKQRNIKDSIEGRFTGVKESKTFLRLLHNFKLGSKRVLDVGCGYGEYLDCFGKGSLGITTTKDEADYATGRGLAVVLGNAEQIDTLSLPEKFKVVWANNIFEHLLSPHAFLLKLKTVVAEDATLILGVPVIPSVAFLMRMEKFRGALVSNHINFFNRRTLTLTVTRAGWHIDDIRSFICGYRIVDKIFGLATPHVYVIAKNNSLFQYPNKKVAEWKEEAYYKEFLSITHQQ